jgi:hypothetical protein
VVSNYKFELAVHIPLLFRTTNQPINFLHDREESWVSITDNAKQAQLIHYFENTKRKAIIRKSNVYTVSIIGGGIS